ncbi:MAG: peptidase S53 [Chloroflexi bacterium]|nr:MAG: peptidase S53 [Chloroflexota bacterium]
MSPEPSETPLPGSERRPLAGARVVGAPNAGERLEVTVVLRPAAATTAPAQPLSRQQLGAARGADPAVVERLRAFAIRNGLEVVDASPDRRTVVLAGTVATLSDAFAVELATYEREGVRYRGRTGPVHVPADLAGEIEGVFGFDDRPQAQPHFRRAAAGPRAGVTGFSPLQVAALYDFPQGLDGTGEVVALIELGGGYRQADLDAYFRGLGLPVPAVSAVAVRGVGNAPTGSPNGPDAEVLLDIEVAGAMAPGARLVAYFAPNTEQGFLEAVTAAVHDRANAPSVISISWGGAEGSWTVQALRAFDAVFADAGAVGVTVCCASGDAGSGDGVGDGRAHVDFPASSPHVLACGGTRLSVAAAGRPEETVWNDGPGGGATGGGISAVFAPPGWQAGAGLPPSANPGGGPGRGVPDVCGDADPATGYQVLVDGVATVIGGTSAVAPLWAALVARLNQRRGAPLGFVNPELYRRAASAGAVRDIVAGSNGAYSARPGWDACTGLGSPIGSRLLDLLAASPAGGPAAP